MKRAAEQIKNYIFLYSCFFVYSISALCAKFAAGNDRLLKILFFIGLEFLCLALYAVMWQQALKKFSLVSAMANKGIVVIFNLFWSVLLFEETITVNNVIGAAVILAGIRVVSMDD